MSSSLGAEGGNLLNNSTDSVRLIRLSAHAVARLDEVPDRKFDSNDLPVQSRSSHHHSKHPMRAPFKKIATFLTARLHTLSYQECELRLIETMDGLHFEVKATTSNRMLYVAPLATLVDVNSDSVIEKDTVVFSQVPDYFNPGVENSSFVVPVESKKKASVLKKGEIISTLFRAYGEIGLSLTFKTPRETGGVASTKPFTKVDLRFLTTVERNRWLTFCAEAYMGLLVDSIRTGTETHTSTDQGPAFRVPELPPAEVINSYVDFFLSAPGKFEGDNSDSDDVCVSQVPCSGLIRMGRPGGHFQQRRVAVSGAGDDTSDVRASDFTLVFHRTSVTQRLKMVPHLKIKAKEMHVYAENEQFGTIFFIDHIRKTTNAGSAVDGMEAMHQAFSATAGTAGEYAVTYELRAENHADREKWLRWLEVVVGEPTMFLSKARKEANMEKEVIHENTHWGSSTMW